ncbi:hypothetical protein [Nannocystis sp. SCPEA4]|uniref:hypothetical protein n=1 Tax=Nannocystis sp. SCPEA4 TaxID=2996787 RepID=UPI0022718E45|nr:hypothetical protein [Nannocystis sp. SCPEA4]MCY1054604.1 hypothetical protein [Nannocystis sp. SCPEA4]
MRPPLLVLVVAFACAPEPPGPLPPSSAPAVDPAPSVPAAPPAAPSVAAPSGHVATDSSPDEPIAPIGVPACDAYIAEYTACEPLLKHEIAGGHRRYPRNEAARLRYLHDEAKDPGLADACKHMLEQLRPHCQPRQPVTAP